MGSLFKHFRGLRMRPIQQRLASVLIVMVVVASQTATASDATEAFPQVKLDIGGSKIRSSSLLRVKIFPHHKNYKPHLRDDNKQELQLVSTHACSVFRGRDDRPARQGKLLRQTNELILKASDMSSPLWIDCPHPVTVVRESHVPHFTYSGSFYVHQSVDGNLELINLVSLNDYLKGVVPSEVYAGWPMETLKTQAVAARSYAVYHLAYSRRYIRSRFWDIDDTIAFQAYTGLSLRSARTDQAVEETIGQILTHDGDVIQAYYHADSGGQTEYAFNVWSYDIPFVAGQKELFEINEETTYQWRRRLSLKTLTRKLQQAGLISAKDEILRVQVPVAGRTESGRVKVVSLQLGPDRYKRLDIKTFRKAIARRLPSQLFVFETDEKHQDRVWIRGLGSGHGVGMSQQGAAILAEKKGWEYPQILDFYYLDTSLCQLNDASAELPNCYELRDALRQDARKRRS